MLKYGDYFSRKTLYRVGVSADKILPIKSDRDYSGDKRNGMIFEDMKGIYQTFVNALADKNVATPQDVLTELNVERKIVSAFYDAGVLSNQERDYFRGQTLFDEPVREQICVAEAEFNTATPKVQSVGAKIENPVAENVRR